MTLTLIAKTGNSKAALAPDNGDQRACKVSMTYIWIWAKKFLHLYKTHHHLLTDDRLNELYERLGELIKEAREKADVKQELLADYLDLSRVSISNIEKGKQKIQIHTLLDLAKYLQTDVSIFLDPLKALLVDKVTEAQENRINRSLETPSATDHSTNDGAKVKEFVNFIKSKNQ